MPTMTDPINALNSMHRILIGGKVKVNFQQCEIHKSFKMHKDSPLGIDRISYFNLVGSLVKAVSIFSPVDPLEGIPCFGVGYAVGPRFRKNGLAKEILTVGIDELKNGLNRCGIEKFYIEAVVDVPNIASQRVAEKIISPSKENCIDSQSGRGAYVYRRKVE